MTEEQKKKYEEADAELLRTKLDYKTEENKRNILAINDLRKRCEDLEAENSKLSKELTDIINGNAEAIPALVVMARDAFAAGRELYEASWIEGDGFIYKDFEDWESRGLI